MLYASIRCLLYGPSLKDVSVQGNERQQVFDIVPAEYHMIEQQAEINHCPCRSQRLFKSKFSQGVEHSLQYGTEAKTLVNHYNSASPMINDAMAASCAKVQTPL